MNKMNSANMEIPTAAELRKLRVVDLRKKLQSLELTQQGERRHGVRRAPLDYRGRGNESLELSPRVHSHSVNVRL